MATSSSDKTQLTFLLKMAGNMINALLEGLELCEPEVRGKIMEHCGEVCARDEAFGPALDIARKIAREEKKLDVILDRTNREISWCGEWKRGKNMIACSCKECGCPIVKHGIAELRRTFCYCSRGWVKTIFEALLMRPVRVDLKKAIGFGDRECEFVVHFEEEDI